jgi:outer membrane receptor for ferrienterochelin and colicins
MIPVCCLEQLCSGFILPNTLSNPVEYRRDNYSPDYFIVNGQIAYKTGIKKSFDIYIGVENAGNVKQPNPILSSD